MDHHDHAFNAKQYRDHDISDSQVPLVSAMLPAFLDYLRVEDHRTSTTLIRYASHIQKFITTIGACPITRISSENLVSLQRQL
jgi:hypothetical protein